MPLIIIAAIVLAVALGLIYFMGKKQKGLTKNPPSQGGQPSTPPPSQPPTPPQPASPPAPPQSQSQGGQPQNPAQ